MLDNKATYPSVKSDESRPADFLWGAAKTGRVIGLNPRQVNGEIKSAHRAALLREMGA